MTRSAPSVRRMRWWDLPEVMVIEREVFTDTAWSIGQYWSELAHVPESRHYVVAVEDERIVGYAGLHVVAPEADVQTIAVAQQSQRRGLGHRLLGELLDEARRRGCTQVFLEVLVGNDPAITLYETHGFERVSTRRDYYGPGKDALIMVLRLAALPSPEVS